MRSVFEKQLFEERKRAKNLSTRPSKLSARVLADLFISNNGIDALCELAFNPEFKSIAISCLAHLSYACEAAPLLACKIEDLASSQESAETILEILINLSNYTSGFQLSESILKEFLDEMEQRGDWTLINKPLATHFLIDPESPSRRLFIFGLQVILKQQVHIPLPLGLRLLTIIFHELEKVPVSTSTVLHLTHTLGLLALVQYNHVGHTQQIVDALREHKIVSVVLSLLEQALSLKSRPSNCIVFAFECVSDMLLLELELLDPTFPSAVEAIRCNLIELSIRAFESAAKLTPAATEHEVESARMLYCRLCHCLYHKSILKVFASKQPLVETFLDNPKNSDSPIRSIMKRLCSDYQIMRSKIRKPCAFCLKLEEEDGNVKFKKCQNCFTNYCSKECQIQDWKRGHFKQFNEALTRIIHDHLTQNFEEIKNIICLKQVSPEDMILWIETGWSGSKMDVLAFDEMRIRFSKGGTNNAYADSLVEKTKSTRLGMVPPAS
ncbi:hypothetical protein BDR26DRAFT_853977 [Obelidium mucronatum]|nr:hypothetical protein BDR26DRAFT_853977 [Obelidium mucronatum]